MDKEFFRESEYFKDGETVKAYYHHVSEFGEITPHRHDFYELNIVLEGNGRHDVGKHFYAVSGGEVFVIPPNVTHSYMFVGEGKVFHLLISETFFDQFEEVLKTADGYNMLFSTQPELRILSGVSASLTLSSKDNEKIQTLIGELFLPKERNHAILQSVTALKLLVELCSSLAITESTASRSKTSGAILALDYISRHIGEKITIEDLCNISYTSRTVLIEEFKVLTGRTPQKYLADFRLKKAEQLLLTTDKKITEIAFDCGFFDNAHFCKEFKRHFGKTPKSLREG